MEIGKELGLMLYYCEGAKTIKTGKVSVTSTDAKMLKYFANWLRNCFVIADSKLRIQLWLRKGEDEQTLKQFWSKLLDVPLEQFIKTYWTPKKGKKAPRGVCRLYYCSIPMLKTILTEAEQLIG